MALAFLLMSRMDPSTSALVQSLYLVILGAGIGLSMQVLVLIVQNTSNFEDLGVATSGVTFFRTIGSSFGAAIFGSLFVELPQPQIGRPWRPPACPPARSVRPEALHRQPHNVAAPIVAAYADSLTQVFFWAAPVALAGSSWRCSCARSRCREFHNSAVDLGDAFGMPTSDTPDQMLENAIARMLRGDPGMRLRSIAMRPDCRLDVAGLWGVLRINRYGQIYGTARLTDMANYLRIPFELLEPTFSRLVAAGYAQRDSDRMWLTPAGAQQVDYVQSLLLAWLVDKLGRSPGLRGPARPARGGSRPRAHRISRSGPT